MYRFFVGIDVSKQWIDASWSEGPTPQYLGQFQNSIPGFKKLLAAVKKLTKVESSACFFCFENTGTYSKLLLQWLCSKQIPCREENALKISKEAGLRRGKSDKLDSGVICRFAYKNRDQLQPSELPPPAIALMKKLLSRRSLLVRQRSALQVSLKEQKAEYPPALFKSLEQQDAAMVKQLSESIQFIEDQIEELIASHRQLKKNNSLAQSVCGVGPIIAWHILAYTNNFNSIKKSRKFSCYVGIAPFPNESGSSRNKKGHVSHMANKQIKALLGNGITAAIVHDKELSAYYKRKIAEGKEPGVVKNAVKNKLVARVFAVVERGTDYVRTHNYA
jgi:transposase